MTRKSILLGTTALAGAALAAVPASAGTVGSGDSYSVELSGEYGFSVLWYDQDQSTGFGRGYGFIGDDAEIYIHAAAVADNGLKYGVRIELNANGDDTNASDEIWAYITSEQWGHVELGNNDDAADRMFISAETIMAAKIGWDGIMFDVVNTGTGGGVTDSFVSIPDDATKIIYFTPRVAGFQLGASLTPDTGVNGRGVFIDNDGTPENVWDLGANWEGSFGDVSMIVSATYETGSQPNLGGPGTAATEDHEVFSVGGTASFKGFSIAGGYADLGEGGITTAASAAGADAGEWWNAAVGYTMGPWTFSLAYMETEKANTTGIADTTWDIFSAGMTYNVAPGWDLLGEIDWFDGKNINATAVPVDNQGTVVILTNYFYF